MIEKVKDGNTIFVLNKSDIRAAVDENSLSSCIVHPASCILKISATRGDGLKELKDRIFESCLKDWKEEREGVVITNLRHKLALEKAKAALDWAIPALSENQPLEILALELRDSLDRLGEIVGAVTTEDILNKIFDDFCIGK